MRTLIFASIFSITSISFGKSVALSIGSGSGKPGWTVELPITLSGGAQPAGLQWSFGYSADIVSVKVAAGGATTAAGKTLTCSGTTCLVFGVNTGTLQDGVVAVATFEIAAAASSPTVAITLNGVVAAAASGASIASSGGSGKITILVTAARNQPRDFLAEGGTVGFLILSSRLADKVDMERRLQPRVQIHFETKVSHLKTQKSGLGQTCDISESGISVMQPLEMIAGDAVRLDMADCVLEGRVIYSNPEGERFRVGIEVQRVQLGDSGLSSLLQRTLSETMPNLPGLEYAEPHFG